MELNNNNEFKIGHWECEGSVNIGEKKMKRISKYPEDLEGYPKGTVTPIQCMMKLEEVWRDFVKSKKFFAEKLDFDIVDVTDGSYIVRLNKRDREDVYWLTTKARYKRELVKVVCPDTGCIKTILKSSGGNEIYFYDHELGEAGLSEIIVSEVNTDIRGIEIDNSGTMLWTTDKDLLSQIKHIVNVVNTFKKDLNKIIREAEAE